MRNFNEHSITEAVLNRLQGSESARVKKVSEALVRHLHDFLREVRPSQEEWMAGIDFLTRTGQLCNLQRQEFILLSDALGVSMLVDAINHPRTSSQTENTVLGPFYVENIQKSLLGSDIAAGMSGQPLAVAGTVTAQDGRPLAGAMIDVWQSDESGSYDVQYEPTTSGGRARFYSDEQGRFFFKTIRPAAYPIPHDGTVGQMLEAQGRHPWRPAHIHFLIEAPGYERLVTHIFFEGDPYLDSDVVFGVKDSLIEALFSSQGETTFNGLDMHGEHLRLYRDFILNAKP